MISALLAMLLMQVGLNPASGQMPGIPEELRDRPPREETRTVETRQPRSELSQCLVLAGSDAQAALDRAQGWRERAADEGELAQSAHCLGLALVRLGRFDEARRIFEIASAEAPDSNLAYRARLSAMAGNAALAQGEPAVAEPLFASAAILARTAQDKPLIAGLLIDRARALVALDRLEEAGAALAEARAEDPANAQAWLLSATLARRQERLGEAQKHIEQAAMLDPRLPATGLEAGVIAALSGRAEDARRSFASVVELAPGSEEAARAQAYLEQLEQ